MLYMVILFDPKGNVCCQMEHNMLQDQAEQAQVKLRAAGQPAFFLKQSCTHLPQVGNCGMCDQEIQMALMAPVYAR